MKRFKSSSFAIGALIFEVFLTPAGQSDDNAKKNTLTPDAICRSLVVDVDINIFDHSGTRLLDAKNENRSLSMTDPLVLRDKDVSELKDNEVCKMKHSWGSSWGDGVSSIFLAEFSVTKRSEILANVTRYRNRPSPGNPEPSVVLAEFKGPVLNFEPIVFKWRKDDRQVVVQLSPRIESARDQELDLELLPLSVTNGVMTSSTGTLVANDFDFLGPYVALSTHKGTFAFSLYPFPGSTPMARAQGQRIQFTLGDEVFTIRSDDPILPGGLGRTIHFLSLPDIKQGSSRSLQMVSSSDPDNWLDGIRVR